MFHTDEKDMETGAGGLGFRGRSTDLDRNIFFNAMANNIRMIYCIIKIMLQGRVIGTSTSYCSAL